MKIQSLEIRRLCTVLPVFIGLCVPLYLAVAQDPAAPPATPTAAPPPQKKGRPPLPGVSTPGVKRDMADLTPDATFPLPGTPDWQVVTDDGVWVSNGPKNTVHRLDAKTGKESATVTVGARPCSGLAVGAGSIWVPNCGSKNVSRVDMKTNAVIETLPIAPADSEGGVGFGAGSFWIVSDPKGVLSRVDPATNKVIAEITVPEKSAAVNFYENSAWVTTPATNQVTQVDAKTNKVVATIEVGPKPRFITVGGGAVWTLNQGDGTVSRIDAKTGKLVTNIQCGLPGGGGEIAYGEGYVWATMFTIPITQIDPAKNEVVKQWTGAGGDSIRAAHGFIWLSNLRAGSLTRYDVNQK